MSTTTGAVKRLTHNHTIADVENLQGSLNAKVDNSKVLTDVPDGAKFTDTTYIVGDGGLTEKNFTATLKGKLDGVATGANNYTHPVTHPASMITADSTHRFVTDSEKATWNAKSDVHSHPYRSDTWVPTANEVGALGVNNNAVSASKLATARNIALGGDLNGSANFDGTSNIIITASVSDDSHNHTVSNVDGLQAALDSKSNTHTHPYRSDVWLPTPIEINAQPSDGRLDNIVDGVSNLPYKFDLVIYGDSDKYYPVHIAGGNQDLQRTIKIWRSYSEQAPGDWYTPTHKGSLMLTWKGNFGSWGGASYTETIYVNTSQYTQLLADCSHVDNSYAYCFMLRGGGGGGAIYHMASDQPLTNNCNYITYREPTAFYNEEKTFDHGSVDPNYDKNARAPITTVNDSRLQALHIEKPDWGDVQSKPSTFTPSAHNHEITDINGLQSSLELKANTTYVDAEIANLVSSAPGTLDTLNELATALGDDPNFATTISTQIGTKLDVNANAVSASKLATARNIALGGNLSGSANFDGSGNITITASVQDDSHNHIISNIDGLQSVLDGKSDNHSHPYKSESWVPTFSQITSKPSDLNGYGITDAIKLYTGNKNIDDVGTYIMAKEDGSWYGGTKPIGAHNGFGVFSMHLHTGDYTGQFGFSSQDNKMYFRSHDVTDWSEWKSISFDGHFHSIANVTGLQSALDTKSNSHTHPYRADNWLPTPLEIGALPSNGKAVDSDKLDAQDSTYYLDWNNFTNKPSTFTATAHNHVITDIDGLQSSLDAKADTTYVDAEIANLVSSAPGTLDTLNELAAALGDDPDFATTVTNSIAAKEPSFTKNTAFNKNFGTTSGTVAEGSHNHNSAYLGINSTASDSNKLGGVAASEYFKDNSVVMNTNPFGGKNLYINSINNSVFRAESRWTVSGGLYNKTDDSFIKNLSDSEIAVMFNGNYDNGFTVPMGCYVKVMVDFNGYFPGYPYGNMYLSHYYNNVSESAKMRVYCNYEPHGIGWHESSFGYFAGNGTTSLISKAYQSKYQISQMELIVYAKDDINASLTMFDFQLDRPGNTEMPFIDKYKENKLYDNLNLNSNKITNLAGPVSGTDAANKDYVDTKLGKTGGTLTGNLTVGTGNTNTSRITLDISNAGSPQISLSDTNGDNWWSVGADDNDNNFSIHGSVTSQTVVNGIVNPHFEITTSGVLKNSGQQIFTDAYHPNTDRLTTARNIALGGDLSGSANFDGSSNITITATVADDSHNHIISNIDGLQSALDSKSDSHTHPYRSDSWLPTLLEIGALSSTGKAVDSDKLDAQDSSYYLDWNNFTNKPSTFTATAHNHEITDINGLQSSLDLKADTTYVNSQIANLAGSAPATLDTLNELAAALGDDPNFATTISTQIGTKLNANANAVSASKLATARNIALGGDLTGSANFDGSGNITITASVVDDSHNHTISNVDGLQTALDGKLGSTANAVSASKLATPRNIALGGDLSGSANFDGSGNITITASVVDDSHNHIISNVDGLQTALDGKLGSTANAVSASKLATTRNISLSGDLSGSANFDGSSNITINAVVQDDSHNHTISNVDNLQSSLDSKFDKTGGTITGNAEVTGELKIGGATLKYNSTTKSLSFCF